MTYHVCILLTDTFITHSSFMFVYILPDSSQQSEHVIIPSQQHSNSGPDLQLVAHPPRNLPGQRAQENPET